jgi:hypothetical protein
MSHDKLPPLLLLSASNKIYSLNAFSRGRNNLIEGRFRNSLSLFTKNPA